LVVELSLEALWRHPIWRAHLRQPVVGRHGNLGGEAKVGHNGREVVVPGALYQHVLEVRELQYCYSNFSSIEERKNCPNRGGFRHNLKQ
jgi:hypothetical protein